MQSRQPLGDPPPTRSVFHRLLFVAVVGLLAGGCMRGAPAAIVRAHPGLVDEVRGARQLLEQERTAARLASNDPVPERVRRLVELGLYDDADSLLATAPTRRIDLVLAEAELRYRQYRFDEARRLVDLVLEQQAGNRQARLLGIRLAIQAWQLDWAEEQARALLGRGRRTPDAALLLGRVHLLRGDDASALALAERVRDWVPGHPGADLLEAEVHLWREEQDAAEAALRRSLNTDPLNADARFAYGYAIWRRGSPAVLPAMQGHWNLALELDPLHLPTHWHLGNGHTALTYADYAAAADTMARAALAPVDSLLSRGRLEEAVAVTREVQAAQPGSVLPLLWRGSVWYTAYTQVGTAALDSAQAAFRAAIRAFPGFGPAHNGMAAVLKQRQFRALAARDSLESAIALTPVAEVAGFYAVFPDLANAPDERLAKMVTQQLGPTAAFVPLLARLGRRFQLLPLHQDLAAATGDASFRAAATFDNRQWMDIRGVGGAEVGAAGVEYLERGSHLERNVLVHELMHLVHAALLTEGQVRRVRELYHAAVTAGRTLDYYSASNEQEYLAQAVEAYLSPAKVHPLTHKAMNTHADLLQRDPDAFAFVATLVEELQAALAGDAGALRSNRAQMYVELSEEVRRDPYLSSGARLERAAAFLDSALVQDGAYVPAMRSYATLLASRGRMTRAEEWLQRAEALAPNDPATIATRAELVAADPAVLPGRGDTRAALLRSAAELETEPLARAGYYRALWELYAGLGRVPEAIALAEDYASTGPILTPPLRSVRNEAAEAAAWLRSEAGYPDDVLPFYRERMAAALADYGLRGRYADVLAFAGQEGEAASVLEDAQRVLDAAGAAEVGITTRLAELRLAAGDTAAGRALVDSLLRRAEPARQASHPVAPRLVRVLVTLDQVTEAHRWLAALPEAREPAQRAEVDLTRGYVSARRGDQARAEELYRQAVSADPYNRRARVALYRLLMEQGREAEAREIGYAAETLGLPAGPALRRELGGEE